MKNILIIGTGSIALQHYNNLIKIKKKNNLDLNFFFHSKSLARGKSIEKKLNYKVRHLEEEKIKNYEFSRIIIATSISEHFKWIKYFASKKNLIFCEKPLVYKKKDLVWLKKNRHELKNKLLVGFQSRFNPIITKIKKEIKNKKNGKLLLLDFVCEQSIKDWRPGTDYRKEFAYGKMNNNLKSIIWELCHDLDLAIFFLGKPSSVYGFEKKLSDLKIKAKDYAEIKLNYDNKVIINISLNMFSPTLYRNVRIIFSKKVLEVNLIDNSLIEIKKEKSQKKKFNWDRKKSLYLEMYNFINGKLKKFAKIQDGINVSETLINFQSNGTKKTI